MFWRCNNRNVPENVTVRIRFDSLDKLSGALHHPGTQRHQRINTPKYKCARTPGATFLIAPMSKAKPAWISSTGLVEFRIIPWSIWLNSRCRINSSLPVSLNTQRSSRQVAWSWECSPLSQADVSADSFGEFQVVEESNALSVNSLEPAVECEQPQQFPLSFDRVSSWTSKEECVVLAWQWWGVLMPWCHAQPNVICIMTVNIAKWVESVCTKLTLVNSIHWQLFMRIQFEVNTGFTTL